MSFFFVIKKAEIQFYYETKLTYNWGCFESSPYAKTLKIKHHPDII